MAECEPNAHQFTLDGALRVDTMGFMNLEVPEYAYMFGFLQADGHLSRQSRQRGRLTVEINARDIDLLREFKRLTPYNSSITERTRSTNFAETHRSATWSLHSLEARTKLNQLGLPYGRKSTTIAPPRVEFSRRDYLRGVIDADGSVGYTSKGLPFMSLTTASTAIGACASTQRRSRGWSEASSETRATTSTTSATGRSRRRRWPPTSTTPAVSPCSASKRLLTRSRLGCGLQT